VLSRSPCTLNLGGDAAIDPYRCGGRSWEQSHRRLLSDLTFATGASDVPRLVVRYEDLAADPMGTAERISRWLPALGTLQPQQSAEIISSDISLRARGRSIPLSEYFVKHPLRNTCRRLPPKWQETAAAFGYLPRHWQHAQAAAHIGHRYY
jgi:hypothetical protein